MQPHAAIGLTQGFLTAARAPLSAYLHDAVAAGGHSGPSPHPPPGGDLAEQLGQFALHLRLKHFILQLLLDDSQEDCI